MNGLRLTLAAGVSASLSCTCLARVAHADEESGLAVGLRVAYGIPFGDAQQFTSGSAQTLGTNGNTTSMASFQRGMLPIWFDLGYRFNRNVYLGLFYQFAPTFPPSGNCAVSPGTSASGQTTCDGFEHRFGIDLQYHILPKELVDPWIGLGLGYELAQLNLSQGAGGDTGSFQAGGPQADLQLGADLRFAHAVPFGPFIDVSLAELGTENDYAANGHGPNGGSSAVSFNTKLHGWVTLGIRAQFNL